MQEQPAPQVTTTAAAAEQLLQEARRTSEVVSSNQSIIPPYVITQSIKLCSIQPAYGTLVALLRYHPVPEIMHEGAPEVFLHQ